MDISSEDQIIPISVPENSSNELSGIHGHNVGSKRNILPPSNPSPRTKKKLQSYQRIIRKYKSRYYNMKRVKCKKLKTDISSLLKKLPGITTYSLAFINCQIEMAKRKKQGFRYQEDMKSLALDIYFHSSKCYRMLSKMFKLPSVRSLQIWLKNVEMVPGFSLIMKHCLSKKVKSFDEISKFCTVVFDEISLKQQLMYNASRDMVAGFENYGHMTSNRIAGYGLVFMIRGIFHNWKLPIGYFFSEKGTPATKLKQLLFECMDLLHEIGLKLKAVICDQGCNNQSLFKMLGISLNKPHIKYHDENIHFLFDAPHLIKCIRNNLQKYGFSVGENEVSWNYIADIYERDKTQSIRALRKITDAHIYLSPFAKMKVKFATQVLSNSVASLICTHIACGTLPPHSYYTANFILMFDKIFDCLNSSTFKAKNEYLSSITDKSIHESFFREFLEFLTLCKVNSERQPPCLNGLKLTITSVMNLWNDLHEINKITHLRTRRLNKDGLENLFAIIRQKSGCNSNPTCADFENSMRHLFVDSLFKISGNSNCEADLDELLLNIQGNEKNIQKYLPERRVCESNITCHGETIPFDIITENVYYYCAGWIAKKIQEMHVCLQCKIVKPNASMDQQIHFFTFFMGKNKTENDFGKLTVPTEEFLAVIKKCETIFLEKINTVLHEKGLHNKLVDFMSLTEHKFNSFTSISMKQTILSYFVKVRIYWAVKYFNRSIVEKKLKKKKFSHV